MKINHYLDRSWFNGLRYTLHIMKIIIILLVLSIGNSFSMTYSQNTLLSLDINKQSIKEVIGIIEKKSEYVFFFSDNVRQDLEKSVDIKVNSKTLDVILNNLFADTDLVYTINDRQVSIAKSKKAGSSYPAPQQQTKTITGTIVDNTKEPLIGVNIVVKGTSTGTVTDIDGKFSLPITETNAVLVISYIGYKSQEIKVGNQSSLNVTLEAETLGLEEIVVVGYGTVKKKDLTGAVSVLEVGDLKDTPVSSVDQMMQGKLSGVNVIPDNMPGGGVAVRVRGFSTIRNNDPLYIIDGVPVEGGINFLNPNDIESMQVLKDASSASIYGARAANGVVIISTKKGKEGTFRVNLDAYVGVQTSAKQMRMLNAQEYGDLLWQAQRNDGKSPVSDVYGSGETAVIPEFLDADHRLPSGDVDWVDEIMQKAMVQSYNLSLAKADKVSSHLFSLGYFNQDGLMKYTGFERISGRFNNEFKLFNDRLKIGENATLSHAWGTSVTNNAALGGMLYNAYKTVSITPVYDLDGNFGSNPIADISNPLGELYRNKDNKDRTTRLFGNLFAELNILEGLYFKTNFGADYKNLYKRSFKAKYNELNTQQPLSTLSTQNRWNFNWVFTNTLNYLRTFDKHTIGALLGIETNRYQEEYFSASREGFASDDDNFHFLDAGDSGSQKNAGSAFTSKMMSYFGKIDYNFDNRYLFAATFRRDGSSKLGNNKWGNFPAVSAGWRISSEPFYDIPAISNMKVRIGWGQNGNSDIPAYSTIDSYMSNPNHSNYPIDGSQSSVTTGYTQTRYGNANLKWETTTQTNVGLDLGFLDNSLTVVLDWFNKDTKDLLWERPLIGTVGGTNQTVWDNVGKMRNRGFEAEVSYNKSINKDFGFNVAFNMSAIKNKMTELDGDVSYIGLPTSVIHSLNFDQEVSRSAIGQPIGSFYAYKEDGLFQSEAEIKSYTNNKGELLQPNAKPGDIKFVDVNGDGVIDGNDRDYIGNPLPDVTAGLTLGVNFHNFDLSLFFQGMFGNDVYDLTRYVGDFYNQSQYNKNSRVVNAWTPTNTNTDIPRVTMDDPNNNIRPSSYYVQDASFVRLKNMKIGYSVPQSILSKIKFNSLYIYAQATNLFTITGYDGIDPEVGLQSYSSDYRNLDMGVDRGIYPLSRTFTFGVNVSF